MGTPLISASLPKREQMKPWVWGVQVVPEPKIAVCKQAIGVLTELD